MPVIERLLATRRGLATPPRRCSRTIESITRYLTTELTFHAGADMATAARLTDSTHRLSKSVIYYGFSRTREIGRKIRKATVGLDPEVRAEPPLDPEPQPLGSRLAPSKDEVMALIAFLTKDLKNSEQPDLRHRAMVMQTVALVSFAIGHRGYGSFLPSTAAIDPHTGFCRLNEKFPDDRSHFRMVWVPPVAQEQISAYESHLKTLHGHVPVGAFQQVEMGQLPFFQLEGNTPRESTITGTWDDLARRAPQFRRMLPHSGRHWLRSNLEGKCSTETLHALFGHLDIGREPWTYGSCLDPILYREDLARTVPACLNEVGWQVGSPRLVAHE